jgi:hypothetical protein
MLPTFMLNEIDLRKHEIEKVWVYLYFLMPH